MMYALYTLDNQFIKESSDIPGEFTGIIEDRFCTRFWHKNGKSHREDGPAIIHLNGTIKWFLFGNQHTEEQHKLLVDIMKLKGLL